MQYRYLGRSGLLVSRVCLGAMAFGMDDWGCDQETATEIVNGFIDAGGNFIDTADMYGAGMSERMTGEAIRGHNRDDLVIATKVWFRMGKSATAKGLSRKHILEGVEASLERLGTDYIDLYQVHGPDWFTPMEETMTALNDLVRSGMVRYIGCSNYYAWQMVKANAIADAKGCERFISAQHMYNLVRRDVEREILPACADQGMGLMCWSPLGGGFLSGRYKRGEPPPEGSRLDHRKNIDIPRYYSDASFDVVEEVEKIAAETGRSMSQVALAWLLHDRRVTSVIVGPRRADHMNDSIMAGDWDLTGEQHARLAGLGAFAHGYPLEWVELTWPNIAGQEEFAPPHCRQVTDRG